MTNAEEALSLHSQLTDYTEFCSVKNAKNNGEYVSQVSKQVKLIRDDIMEKVRSLGLSSNEEFGLLVALDEALSNSVKHGNLGLDSKIRENEGWEDEWNAIERDSDIMQRVVAIQVQILHKMEATGPRITLKVTITDQGDGFTKDDIPDPTDPANLEKASGRGIMLMRNFLLVDWNEKGNQVVMQKHFDLNWPELDEEEAPAASE